MKDYQINSSKLLFCNNSLKFVAKHGYQGSNYIDSVVISVLWMSNEYGWKVLIFDRESP